MRWAKDSIISYRHGLLRDFIVKHLQAAQAKADSIRERASRAIERWSTDPLCKLIACWGALNEYGRCSTEELVGLAGYDLPGGPLRKENQ